MADPILKFLPEQKGPPPEKPRTKLAAEPRRRLMAGLRRYRRFLLLVVLPLVAAIAGFTFYLNGGRYVTTDDAYVGAQKVLITPEVSGKVLHIAVVEGQQLAPGEELFSIDPEPYRLAAAEAEAKAARVRTDFDNLKSSAVSLAKQIELSRESVAANQADFEAIKLRQRVAHDISKRSVATKMIGIDVTMPVAIAPTGMTSGSTTTSSRLMPKSIARSTIFLATA